MAETITLRTICDLLGSSVASSIVETVDNVIKASETIPAGVAGVAGAAGVMTLPEGHGFTDASVVCCTWATGRRYGCTITAYDATSVTLATGAGDSLPTSGAVVIGLQVEIDMGLLGTNAKFINIKSDVACTATLEDSGGVELARDIAAGASYIWADSMGDANPITSDQITLAHVSNAGIIAGTATIIIGYDND